MTLTHVYTVEMRFIYFVRSLKYFLFLLKKKNIVDIFVDIFNDSIEDFWTLSTLLPAQPPVVVKRVIWPKTLLSVQGVSRIFGALF